MDSTVKAMCNSMENDIDRWEISTSTLNDLSKGDEYWISDFRCTWNGFSLDRVFSSEQSALIRESYYILVSKKATTAQQKVTDSFEPCEYGGVVSNLKSQQKIMNTLACDQLLNIDARPEFESWFDANIEFGFGMGWMKGMAKKFCWYGYFAGYKKGLSDE